MDILIPLGHGSKWHNNELRYCLRSIERYATGYDRIFIIGEDPEFLQKETKETKDSETSFSSLPSVKFFLLKDIRANKQARIAHKIFWAFQKTDISDQAILFNDDYVLTGSPVAGGGDPGRVDLRRIPHYHRGSLSDAVLRQKDPVYRRSLEETIRVLEEAGKPTFHYDIHVPIILERHAFLGLEKWWQKSLAYPNGIGLVVKSIYANNTLGGSACLQDDDTGSANALGTTRSTFSHDCKLRRPYPARIIDGIIRNHWVFSYSDEGLTPTLKQWLANKFPEKSKWEKNETGKRRYGETVHRSLTHSPVRPLATTTQAA